MAQFTADDVQRALMTNLTGETAVIAAPGAGKRIVILGLMLIPDAVAAAIEIESGTTDIIPIFDLAADTPLVLPPGPVPWLVCTANEALNVTADAAINGVVLYVVETV